MEALQQILLANPELQHAYLANLNFTPTFMTTTAVTAPLPSIPLHSLRTLELIHLPIHEAMRVLAMLVPGNYGLSLLVHPYSAIDDTLSHQFVEFCRRSHVERIVCRSLESLRGAIAVTTRLEVLVFQQVILSREFYDLIAPPTNDNDHSTSQRLPEFHTLYILECLLSDLDSLGRVCSACPIRNIGLSEDLALIDGTIPTVEDFERWVGPGISVNVIPRDKITGYRPFGLH